MKIAVAILDSDSDVIASHMRSTEEFAVFEVQAGQIQSKETRRLPHSAEGHDAFLRLLADCSAVLCGGMGSRVAESFSRYGIEPVVVVDVEQTPQQAVHGFLSGALRRGEIHGCCCQNHH